MNWLISGSVALKHWFPDFKHSASDVDLISPYSVKCSTPSKLLVDVSWHDAGEMIFNLNSNDTFLDADLLYTLKVSHANWDIKWEKTISHIMFLQNKNCKLNDELYLKLISVWNEVHGKKSINLNQPVDQFFQDHVNRKYDHEYLHKIVKFNDRPMHEMIRKDLSIAFVSKEMFFNLSKEKQIETMLEEAMVIAIERFGALKDDRKSTRLIALSKALKCLIVNMTTGWFSKELILNYENLLFKGQEKWTTKLLLAKTLLNNA